jgi:signal transduction histidine kinase
LLQNAFKFTKPLGTVWLGAYSSLDRVLIEVEDECGGLLVGDAEDLFRLFAQKNGSARHFAEILLIRAASRFFQYLHRGPNLHFSHPSHRFVGLT